MNVLGLPLNEALRIIKSKSLDYALIETGINKMYPELEETVFDKINPQDYRVVKINVSNSKYVLTIVKK